MGKREHNLRIQNTSSSSDLKSATRHESPSSFRRGAVNPIGWLRSRSLSSSCRQSLRWRRPMRFPLTVRSWVLLFLMCGRLETKRTCYGSFKSLRISWMEVWVTRMRMRMRETHSFLRTRFKRRWWEAIRRGRRIPMQRTQRLPPFEGDWRGVMLSAFDLSEFCNGIKSTLKISLHFEI
jgi:hypothetical protein